MNLLYSVYLTVNPSPIEGDLKPGLEEGDITPGLLGFLATLFLALCVVFLIRDMVKRIRRVRYRAQAAGHLDSTDTVAFAAPRGEEAQGAEAEAAEAAAAPGAEEAGAPESGTSEPATSETAGKRSGADTAG